MGLWGVVKWFQFQWEEHMQEKHIAVKELISIIVATLIWGPELQSKSPL